MAAACETHVCRRRRLRNPIALRFTNCRSCVLAVGAASMSGARELGLWQLGTSDIAAIHSSIDPWGIGRP